MNVQGSAPNLETDSQSDSMWQSITANLQQELMLMHMQNAELQDNAKRQNDQLMEYNFQLQVREHDLKNRTDSLKVLISNVELILFALGKLAH